MCLHLFSYTRIGKSDFGQQWRTVFLVNENNSERRIGIEEAWYHYYTLDKRTSGDGCGKNGCPLYCLDTWRRTKRGSSRKPGRSIPQIQSLDPGLLGPTRPCCGGFRSQGLLEDWWRRNLWPEGVPAPKRSDDGPHTVPGDKGKLAKDLYGCHFTHILFQYDIGSRKQEIT